MNWIKRGDQLINLDLVSEIWKHFDGKHHIKFKLTNSLTSFTFKDKETRDKVFKQIESKIHYCEMDI